MTTAAEPTAVQVMAARVRLKADRKLHRESPAAIKAIAKTDAKGTQQQASRAS